LILDTTYLLPLARVGIDTDLLRAIADRRADIEMSEVAVSLISLFELQAKAAKLGVPAGAANDSVGAILDNFAVVPFSSPEIVKVSFALREETADYIDCVVMATAAVRREGLASEDSKIWRARRVLHDRYGVDVYRYRDLVKATAKAT